MTDLVIQAPLLAPADVSAIATLADAQGITVLDGGGQQAFRLARVGTRACVAEFCALAGIDAAFVPADARRTDVRLLALDMDSTLITIECVDEIADLRGVKPEVAAITAAAMRGEIDFRESLAQRVALLAGLDAGALERVYAERLTLSPGAERLLDIFKAAGAQTLLVSGGFSFFTDRLKQRLRFDDALSNTLEVVDGKLTGRLLGPTVDAAAKAARFGELRQRACADGGTALAIGDGANDLPMLRLADVSVAYRAKPVVRAATTYAINYCGLDAVLNLFA